MIPPLPSPEPCAPCAATDHEHSHKLDEALRLLEEADHQDLELALRKTERLVRRIAAAVPDHICIYDVGLNRCTYRNRSLLETLGYAAPGTGEVLSLESMLRVIAPDDVATVVDHYEQLKVSLTDDIVRMDVRMVDSRGETQWRSVRTLVFHRDEAGKPSQLLSFVQDISQLKRTELLLREQIAELESGRAELERRHEDLMRLNERLGHLATRDGLTEVFNHRALKEKLVAEVARSRRHHEPLALIMCDVDDFKAYNDRFGHPAGDGRLKEFVRTISLEVRTEDFVARYGGEEFVIVLPNTSILESHAIAQRILVHLNAAEEEHRITASFGCAELHAESGGPEQLIRDADRALYRAKRDGKNRIRISG